MIPSDALQVQMDTENWCRRALHEDWYREWTAHKVLVAFTAELLARADPFLVSPAICDVIEVGAATFPDAPFDVGEPSSSTGFAVFEKPLNSLPMESLNGIPVPPYLSALGWHKTDTDAVIFVAFALVDGVHQPLLTGPIQHGHTLEKSIRQLRENDHLTGIAPDSTDVRERIFREVTYARSFWAFCRQPLVERSVHRASRHLVHRFKRERQQEPPLIRVVALRARHYEKTGEGDGAIEYQCQWFVRGHWHQYWVGPKGGQRLEPRWVAPYVKGPEDKPLKRPSTTVFAVVR